MNRKSSPLKKNLVATSKILTIVIVLYPLFFLSCARKVSPLSEAACHLLSILNSGNGFSGYFKGTGTLIIFRKEKVQTMRLAWVGIRPGSFKMQAVDPWGNTIFQFFLKDGFFYIRSANDDRYYKGKGSPRNLDKVLSIPVDGEELVAIFSGHPPIIPFRRAAVQSQVEESSQVLLLYRFGNQIAEKIWFSGRQTVVDRAALFDAWGRMKYTTEFADYKMVNDKAFPHEIRITRSDDSYMALRVGRMWTGFDSLESAFTPDLSNTKVIDLDS